MLLIAPETHPIKGAFSLFDFLYYLLKLLILFSRIQYGMIISINFGEFDVVASGGRLL